MAQIQSGATADLLTVDAVSKAARATLYDANGLPVIRTAGEFLAAMSGVQMMGSGDGNALPVRTDHAGNIGTTNILPLLWDQYEGTVVNSQRWQNTATTFVTAQTATGLNLNSSNLTTVNAVNVFFSRKSMVRAARNPLFLKCRGRFTNYANTSQEWGLCDAVATNVQIANGAYFQFSAAGVLQAVIATLSSPVAQPLVWSGANVFDLNKFYTYDIILDDDNATFNVQDTATGQIVATKSMTLPASAARLFATTHLRAYHRVFNAASAPATAPVHLMAFMYVGIMDAAFAKSSGEVFSGNHLHTGINPATLVQLSQYANSAEPASATLSNTAAGYTTLGGKFQFAAVAGAVTDYALFGFQVPAGYTLNVKAISIDLWNTGAAVATTATLLSWSTFANSPAVSLASALPGHRQHLGAQSLPIGAVVGALANTISKQYNSPLITEGGNFFIIAVRIPVGTATATEVLAGAIQVDGYFE